jgi:GntR family transcriptional regulator/MocR family aminotransferase
MPRSPWEPAVAVERDAALPPFLQIARTLAADIQRGRLRPGDRLPGSRRLAESLQVHRNTVLAALAELMAEGWIEATRGRGTFVTQAIVLPRGRSFSGRLALRTHVPAHMPIALPETPPAYRPINLPAGTLNLSNGAPDVRLVPAASIGRAYRRVLGRQGAGLLAYGYPEGHGALRTALASMLASTRGLAARPDDVLVTRGSQMALMLAAPHAAPSRRHRRRGRVRIPAGLGSVSGAGARVVPVGIDGDGIDIESVEPAGDARDHSRRLRHSTSSVSDDRDS